ncbi:TetR/AcrR family transcriptional regulator [Actinoplanes sp. NPDC051411]|uniref:TetR/AcrR family transcriptional regulator n=1 Tax=Actinoplanes sp. NPDC051411 TaxID=3155522 RepID=UPI0034322B2C
MGRPMQFDADAAVESAMQVFWRNGYAATTPQALTAELGIGKGSLYNTFGSKHSLFVRSLARYSTWRTAFLADNFSRPAPVRRQLREAVVALTGYGEHDRGCLLVNASAELGSTDHTVTDISAGLFAGIEDAFRAAIQRGQRDGELAGAIDAGAQASALLTTVIGTSLLLKARTDQRRVRRTIDATIERL